MNLSIFFFMDIRFWVLFIKVFPILICPHIYGFIFYIKSDISRVHPQREYEVQIIVCFPKWPSTVFLTHLWGDLFLIPFFYHNHTLISSMGQLLDRLFCFIGLTIHNPEPTLYLYTVYEYIAYTLKMVKLTVYKLHLNLK